MPKNNDLQMPEEIRCKRINLVQRNHDYDRQMYHLLNPNRAYLKKYLRWLDKNKTFEDTVATTSDMLEKWCRGQQFNYLITDKKGKLLGAIGIGKINNLDRHVEFGYWLSQDQNGHGYMSEALKKLEQILFARKIRRLEIECVVSNQLSANVALRNGYEKECIKKEYFNINGIFEDAAVYVKMNPRRHSKRVPKA